MRTSIGARNIKKWSINYNSKGYVKIPSFKVEAGDEFHCQVIIFASDEPVSYSIIDGKSSRMKIGFATNSTGIGVSLVSTLNVRAFVDNVEIPHTTSVTSAEVNTVINLKLIFTETHYLEYLGGNIAGTELLNGRLFNIRMKSKYSERYYPSFINATRKPNIDYLQDYLNKWRPNQWTPNLISNTIRIPSWVANEDGDSINFKLKLNSIASKFMHITDENVTESVPSGSRSFITFDKLAPHSLIIYPTSTRVEINGRTYASKEFIPLINTEYQFIITYPKGIIVDFLGGRYEGDFSINGVMWDIKMNSAKDNRHYPAIIESDIPPETLELTDIIAGKNALRILNTRREKIIVYSTPSHYQSILPKSIPLWTNLSSDGELINFEDQHWVEF